MRIELKTMAEDPKVLDVTFNWQDDHMFVTIILQPGLTSNGQTNGIFEKLSSAEAFVEDAVRV